MKPPQVETEADLSTLLQAELLVAAAAHDLKAPLVTIQGFLSGLSPAAHAGNWEQFGADIDRIHRACDRMRRLLDDLRELARENTPLRRTTAVSMEKVIAEALEQLAGQCPAGVDIEVSRDLPTVRGEELRLLRVFQNILENALRSVRGQPHPRIEVSVATAGDQAVIAVTDNGTGLDPNLIPQVFQPYRQLGGREGSCGLGMAIAQRIVTAHGGEISLASDGVGQGATVRVTLPLHSPAQD